MTPSLALSATDNVFCPQPAPRYVIDVTLIICYESEKACKLGVETPSFASF